jgi:hypothetical protein
MPASNPISLRKETAGEIFASLLIHIPRKPVCILKTDLSTLASWLWETKGNSKTSRNRFFFIDG